ncbi:orotidine-5'-phosphate decarboxylase [Tessaracoccus lubricantis]|uniref:Orotidine-5'-phosphate decarboxylase n=1 Tax=Tessaracoccus lubricantis TaxID=545543 RepID=A0ABP9FHR3_9ACTN
MTYAQRLAAVTAERGRLCVGIDPMPAVLDAWGLPHTVDGLERCARGIVEEIGSSIAVFKPQSAFFEAFGSRGVAVLERVLGDIRAAGALSILDVKRGDIGSSMAGYAAAFLGDDAPTRADAITLSPYLGVGSLKPAIDAAVAGGQGLYVLARTSNPEGAEIQLADAGEVTVAQHVVDTIAALNPEADHAVGLVVGGTHTDSGCDLTAFNASVLVPGIGAQGGTIEALSKLFGQSLPHVLPTASRGVIGHGRDKLKANAHALVAEIASLLP